MTTDTHSPQKPFLHSARHVLFAAVLLALILPGPGVPGGAHGSIRHRSPQMHSTQLAVLAAEDDPYLSLAEEIASVEDAPLVHTLTELAAHDPATVLWVAAPETLGDEALVAMAQQWQAADRYPATGLITGSTLDLARALWLRGREVPGPREENTLTVVTAGGTDHNSGVHAPTILTLSPEPQSEPLTEATLIDTLTRADLVFWSRHVSRRYWFWYEGEEPDETQRLGADEIPPLGPVVLYTPSCASFTPWSENSIALAFVDRGAAAYVGDRYPPLNSGGALGDLSTPPAQASWPGVPVGLIAQAHNRATGLDTMTLPNLFVLGDPRVALLADPPYTVTSDESDGDRRLIRGTWEGAGAGQEAAVLPLRIADGAEAGFVRVTGSDGHTFRIAATDAFHSSRLQMLNAGADLVVLVLVPPGDFEIELRARAPLGRRLVVPLRDALDFVWAWISPAKPPAGSDALTRVLWTAVPLAVIGVIVALLRRHGPLEGWQPALISGIVAAALQTGWVVARVPRVSIIGYPLGREAAVLAQVALVTAALVVGGLLWRRNARRWLGRACGLALAVAPELLVGVVYVGAFTLINAFQAQRSGVGVWPLSYAPVRLISIVLVAKVWVVMTVGTGHHTTEPG